MKGRARERAIVALILVAGVGCQGKGGAAGASHAGGEEVDLTRPVTAEELTYALTRCEATRHGANHYVLRRRDLAWLAARPIWSDGDGFYPRDGFWLGALIGHPGRDILILQVDGRPVATTAGLQQALVAGSHAGALTLTVKPRPRPSTAEVPETTIHLRAGEPIDEAMLDRGISWRSEGVASIRRELFDRMPFEEHRPGQDDRKNLLARLGFRHEDLLIDVNGFAICGDAPIPPELLEAETVTWTLERAGRRETLRWDIER